MVMYDRHGEEQVAWKLEADVLRMTDRLGRIVQRSPTEAHRQQLTFRITYHTDSQPFFRNRCGASKLTFVFDSP